MNEILFLWEGGGDDLQQRVTRRRAPSSSFTVNETFGDAVGSAHGLTKEHGVPIKAATGKR